MIDRRTMAARIRDVNPVPKVTDVDPDELGAFFAAFGERLAAAHAIGPGPAGTGQSAVHERRSEIPAHGGTDMTNITTERPASTDRIAGPEPNGRRLVFGFALLMLLAAVGITGWWIGSSDDETAVAAPPADVESLLGDFYAAFAAYDGDAMAGLLAEDFVAGGEFTQTPMTAEDFVRRVGMGESFGWALEPLSEPLMIGDAAVPFQPQCYRRLDCNEPGAYLISVDVMKRTGIADSEGFSVFFIVEEDGVPKIARYEHPLPYYLGLTLESG